MTFEELYALLKVPGRYQVYVSFEGRIVVLPLNKNQIIISSESDMYHQQIDTYKDSDD